MINQEAMWQMNLSSDETMELGSYPERPGEPDCSYYIRTGLCRFGSTCRFNHPRDRELVIATARMRGEYPERIGQPECEYYLKTGTCKFGVTCKFHHPRNKAGIAGRVSLNMLGYPLRSNEVDCAYFLRTGHCKFGATCKFNHPQPQPTTNLMVPTSGQQQSYPWSRASFIPSPRWQDPSGFTPLMMPQGVVWNPYTGQLGSVSPSGTGNDHNNYRELQQNESGSSVPQGGIYALPSESVFPERPGQPECQFYMKTGDCKFGTVCKFHHPRDRQTPPPDCLLSPIGLPLRPGEPLCVFYSRYRICKFGPSCKFHHPMGVFTYDNTASETDEVLETTTGHSRRLSVSETRQAATTSGQDTTIDTTHQPKPNREPMDWTMRMQIAYGAAQGLEYLHDKVDPPVIYRDLKASNILLDDDLCPKLCDFGLHKLGPGTGDKMMALSSRVMGTYGYSAPEYTRGGTLTTKSDVYSFGVVLLELITGRKALDTTKPNDEQNLVSWAQPIFRDPKRYPDMVDPILKKKFSERGLNQAVAIASMCVQEEPTARPLISDVMVALSFLSMSTEDGIPTAVPMLSFKDKSMSIALSRHDSNLVSPTPEVATEDDKSSTSSDEESSVDNEKEMVNKKKKKKLEEEDSLTESDDGSDSNSDDEHEKDQESQPPKPVDEKNQAQSLKIKYRYSWEDVDINEGRLSSKSSQKSNDGGSISSGYESNKDHDDLPKEKEEKEEDHTHLEHMQSSKTDDSQSVYFDDDDDSGDDNEEVSLHRVKSEVEVGSFEDDSGASLHHTES